jgi:hypothetical protein
VIARLALALARHRTHIRIAFWLYALALFTATHWPALEVHVPYIQRPDLIVHFTAFGTWFAILWATGYVGKPLAHATVLRAFLIACAYAALDEGLQAIPWVHRDCALDDYLANCGGITLAAIGASIITLLSKRPGP